MGNKKQETSGRLEQQPISPLQSATIKPSVSVSTSSQYKWLIPALFSGTFAALNGLFAKLTTTTSTAFSHTLCLWLPSLAAHEYLVELLLRVFFFTLNLVSNGIMWTLFTKALKAGDSATRVSVVNTSINFLVTAFLGAGVFGEKLTRMWFLGAACLVAGNVIISRGESHGVDIKSDEKGNKQL